MSVKFEIGEDFHVGMYVVCVSLPVRIAQFFLLSIGLLFNTELLFLDISPCRLQCSLCSRRGHNLGPTLVCVFASFPFFVLKTRTKFMYVIII